jgi:hypothetical protein
MAAPAVSTAQRSAVDAQGQDDPKWYLSFDCATKTFAWTLSRIELDAAAVAAVRRRAERLAAAVESAVREEALLAARDGLPQLSGRQYESLEKLIARATKTAAALRARAASWVRIADGATVDLFPGRPDATIGTVERLKAVSAYVRGRVMPSAAALPSAVAPPAPRVLIEYQMGQNPSARAVANALVVLFADHDVWLVGPSLKNTVNFSTPYSAFVGQYRTAYTANKAHAAHNFAEVERLFGTAIPPGPAAARGHMADSFMQALAFVASNYEKNAAKF